MCNTIKGLRIEEENIELVFEYDSDWSALGEGDDSDSNAENHPGEFLFSYSYFINSTVTICQHIVVC